ncbi:MAG: Ldh family oxidoreductase, partial [Acetobacteraceae bacterium]|nr:Ldh family oxidoreductase [Acetobacteraceae bacterium]
MPADALEGYVVRIFTASGCAGEEAARIGHHLVSANLAGHDSHGVLRVPRYVQWLGEGKVRAGQTLTVVTESATHAVLDGNKGFGQTIGPLAVDLGIAKARESGLAVVALRNAGHLGRIGDWAERAARAGLVSIHFVNVGMGLLVAPFGGVDRRFGTNPFCVGVPQGEAPPLLLDFATSLVAEGKVLVAAQGGKPIPGDALIAPDGQLSGDPETLFGPLEGRAVPDASGGEGALRAFGEHKGSGIAFMCEILAGCLTGSPTGGSSPEGRRGGIVNGMLSIYLAPVH